MEEDVTSLTHTKWRCQYHLVFAPKYRRKIIYGKYKLAIGKILRRIIERIEGAEIAYLCKHESGCLAGEGKKEQCRIKELTGRDVYVREFEDIKRSSRVNSAGRASYVERNQWMINNSVCAIFYINNGKRQLDKKSGTYLTYEYAKMSGICIIVLPQYTD